MQLRDLQRLVGKVDALDPCPAPRHRLGEEPAAAADIERRFPGELREAVDPVQAQRVDLVERLELALRIPPAVRERAEFFQFLGVGVPVRTELSPRHRNKKALPGQGFSKRTLLLRGGTDGFGLDAAVRLEARDQLLGLLVALAFLDRLALALAFGVDPARRDALADEIG